MSLFGGGGGGASGNSGFSFGSQPSSFSFGQPSTSGTTKPASTGLFTATAGQSSGFSFGQTAASSQPQPSAFSTGLKPATGGLFGSQTPSSSTVQSQPSGFGFGASGGSSGLSFGVKPSASVSAAPSAGFGFGSAPLTSTTTSEPPKTGGFSFGSSAFSGQAPSSAHGGQAPSSASGAFSLNQKPATEPAKPTLGFNIGGAAAFSGGGNLLGGAKPTQVTSASGFSFGLGKPADKPVATSVASFGGGTTGFKLGTGATATSTQATQPSTGGFSFGSAPAGSAGGFSSLSSSTAASQPSSGFNLASSFSTPKSTAPATTSASGFGFSLGSKLGTTTSSASTTSTPAPAAGGFSLGGKTSSSTTGLGNLGTSTATSTAVTTSTSLSSGFKLGGATSLFSASTTATTASTSSGPAKSALSGTLGKGFTFGATSTAATTVSTVVTSTTTPATSTAATATMKYSDLEAKVNSWISELEQQEKLFLTQATHVNAWNKLLIENADKITNLNTEFENVELSQKRLNAELDYIKTQQNDLEELLKPLEETTKQQMANLSSSVHTQHADIERERTYNLAENIDSQLKNMAQDLREVVEHINSTSTPANATNPVFQIGKILSAHMDSLQWLDSNSTALQHKVQDMTKQVDQMKREHESKFRLAFS